MGDQGGSEPQRRPSLLRYQHSSFEPDAIQVPKYVSEAWRKAEGQELGRLTVIDKGDGQVLGLPSGQSS